MPETGGRIRWMMTITVAFVAAVVIVLPVLAAVFLDWRDLRQQPAETAQRATDQMATGLVGPLWDHRIPAVRSALEALRRNPDVAAARVLGGTGAVIVGFGTLPPALDGVPFFQSPVLRDGSVIGTVQILFSTDRVRRAADQMAASLVEPLWNYLIPAAQTALEALRRNPDVVAARVLSEDGSVFGSFGTLPPSPALDGIGPPGTVSRCFGVLKLPLALEGLPFFQSPVMREEQTIGAVQVLFSADRMQQVADQMATGLVGPLWDHRIPAVRSALEALRRNPDVVAARVLGGTGAVIVGFGTLPPVLDGVPFFQSPVLRDGSAIGSVQVLYSADWLQDRAISGVIIASVQAVIAMIVIVFALVWMAGNATAAARQRVG